MEPVYVTKAKKDVGAKLRLEGVEPTAFSSGG